MNNLFPMLTMVVAGLLLCTSAMGGDPGSTEYHRHTVQKWLSDVDADPNTAGK